uniref:Uncharacterized protein n=1 Tax=Salix viminalis TaxID=40686 RepID=A0A6N2K539_SALVM
MSLNFLANSLSRYLSSSLVQGIFSFSASLNKGMCTFCFIELHKKMVSSVPLCIGFLECNCLMLQKLDHRHLFIED